ncbi:MAG: family 43 glycosylhydrolase [Aestuariibacter sp.]|nr:family 43 glycosylhydrolase [Aestuariibacter sp.]
MKELNAHPAGYERKYVVRLIVAVVSCLCVLFGCDSANKDASTAVAPQPLYQDPVYDGAADPSIVWDKQGRRWLMFYTNRRANVAGLQGVEWVHGTPISIATSKNGREWDYLQDAQFNGSGVTETLWAPDVFVHNDQYHMYLTMVPGIFDNWSHPRTIAHFTSADLLSWTYQSTLKLNTEKVIDADVIAKPNGGFRLFYNDEPDGKSIYFADSEDLYDWQDKGKAALSSRGEGPVVFYWQGWYWMVVDAWRGLSVYRSADLDSWQQQSGYLLSEPGKGEQDGVIGQHPDVVVQDGRAFLFYFTHPGNIPANEGTDDASTRRSVIQVTELEFDGQWLQTDRDQPVTIDW